METNQSLMANQLQTCKNCDQQFDEDFKFCPHCGQQAKDELTVKVLFYNTISNYFSFDARFFKSFVPLMIKPGFLPSKFVEGKRLWYIHPAQIYLFISVVFFFVFSFYIRDSRSSIDNAMKNDVVFNSKKGKEKINNVLTADSLVIDSILNKAKENMDAEEAVVVDSIFNELKSNSKVSDSLTYKNGKKGSNWETNFGFNEAQVDSLVNAGATDSEIYKAMGVEDDAGFLKRKFYSQMLKFYKERGLGAIYQTFFDSIPIAMFFLLPIFALLLKIFYYRKGKYVNHLVFSFYFFSFLFTIMALVLAINRFLWDIPNWIDTLIVLSTFFYFLIALKSFYKQGWFLSFIKSGMVSFLFSIVIFASTIVLGLFAFMNY
ncbi:MAG: DUF3667 domain-containing protein [Tamlana sp.]